MLHCPIYANDHMKETYDQYINFCSLLGLRRYLTRYCSGYCLIENMLNRLTDFDI